MKNSIISTCHKANFLKLFFFATFILIFGLQNSSATHAAGGEITYTHLTGNQYLIHVTFYRDCAGVAAPTSMPVSIQSVSCSQTLSFTATALAGTGQEITHSCPTAPTTCVGGSYPGIQKWEFEVQVAIPGQCTDWNISTSWCCRNLAITTLQNPNGENLYLEANLNNSASDNTSPYFSVDPIVFVCLNSNFYYNNGTVDPDGDSLAYSFITPRSLANQNVVYNAGYSVTNPISSTPAVSIDPITGDIFMHATAVEVGVIAVLIQEFRNGQLIGSVLRDIQIYTVTCTNILPTVTGINGTNVFTTSACAGANVCFDVFSNDPDAGQLLTMTWSGTIPAATFDTLGSPHPTGTFCWQTTLADARPQPYTFTVTIADDNCPSNGVQVFSYSIYIGGGLVASMSSTPVTCNGASNGTATCTITGGGTGPFAYLWSPGQLTGQTITGLRAGTYTVFVQDSSGCQVTQSVTVTQPPVMSTQIQNLVDASCGANGSFDILTTGGTPGYTYYTNTVPPTTGTSVSAPAGTYTVTVRDANNCRTLTQVTIGSTGSLQATGSHTDVTCNGDHDGSATVTVIGGTGNETFTWTPNVSTTNSATGIAAGTYTIEVSNGTCSTQVVIIINEPAALTVSEVHTDVRCNGSADGTIDLTVSGGTGSYTYLWAPNVSTTSSASGLFGGGYHITITDANGCINTLTVTIAEPPAINVAMSSSPASCLLNNGSASAVATGGAGGFTYSWSPVAGTGSTLSNIGVGTYTVEVTDAIGCTATASVTVNSTGVNASVSSQTDATCDGGDDGSATVTVTGGQTPYTYLWSPTGGTGATATGLSPGTYTVTINDYLGCGAIVTVVIGYINPAPSVDLGPDTTVCLGTIYTLDAGAGMASYLWSDNSTGQTLDVTVSGTYGVVVTDANGCQNSSNVTVAFIQCVNPQPSGNSGTQLSVYPNPAHQSVSISISQIRNEMVKIELTDILGNTIYSSNQKSELGYRNTIDLGNFKAGIYLLKVSYLDQVRTLKVVKD